MSDVKSNNSSSDERKNNERIKKQRGKMSPIDGNELKYKTRYKSSPEAHTKKKKKKKK